MKIRLFLTGIIMLGIAAGVMAGCANDTSSAEQKAALLGIGAMTEEEVAFSIAMAVPSPQDVTMSSGSEGSKSVSTTREMAAELSKRATAALLKSELTGQGAREAVSIIIDDTCEQGTCYTLSGTGSCLNGGSMTFNDMKMSLDMVLDGSNADMTGVVDGSITYANCGGRSQNWLAYPAYAYAVIDGTVIQNDQTEYVDILLAGDILSGSYATSSTVKGTKTVTSGSVSVNGMSFSEVELYCITDLMKTTQVSNQKYESTGSIFTISAEYIETITGRVTVDGTLGPENEINAERIFNTETFRYRSVCTMDTDNFSVNCSVSKM